MAAMITRFWHDGSRSSPSGQFMVAIQLVGKAGAGRVRPSSIAKARAAVAPSTRPSNNAGARYRRHPAPPNPMFAIVVPESDEPPISIRACVHSAKPEAVR